VCSSDLTNLTEFAVSDAPARIAYVEGTCATGASPCAGDLFLVTSVPGTAKKVDSDACSVVFPRRWGGQGVSYRSPCVDRRLVVYGPTKSSGGDPSRIVLGDVILGNPDVDFMRGTAYVFYAKADDSKPGGTLIGGVLGEPLATIGEHPTRDSSQGAPIVDKAGSAWRATIEFDDKLAAGRLVTWETGGELTEIAANVTQISGSVAIVDYDGSVGNLVQLSGTTISKPLARKVPRRGILSGDPGIAVIADYDGDVGTLLALRDHLIGLGVTTWVLHVVVPVGKAADPHRAGLLAPAGVQDVLEELVRRTAADGVAIDIRLTSTHRAPNSTLLISSRGELAVENVAEGGKSVFALPRIGVRRSVLKHFRTHVDLTGHAGRYLNGSLAPWAAATGATLPRA